MAKILFIVNEHPNEAFAISVARETEKILKETGNEVVWYKIPFKETVLGKVMANPNMKITRETLLNALAKSYERAEKLIKKYRSNFTYDFHTTTHNNPFWWTSSRKKRCDFHIALSEMRGSPFSIVEIKAHYKNMPRRHLKKGAIEIPPHSLGETYLRKTTSQKLMRRKGLTPEEFGKAIAQRIEGHITAWKKKLELRNERASIPRVFPKIRQRKIHRRIPRA